MFTSPVGPAWKAYKQEISAQKNAAEVLSQYGEDALKIYKATTGFNNSNNFLTARCAICNHAVPIDHGSWGEGVLGCKTKEPIVPCEDVNHANMCRNFSPISYTKYLGRRFNSFLPLPD